MYCEVHVHLHFRLNSFTTELYSITDMASFQNCFALCLLIFATNMLVIPVIPPARHHKTATNLSIVTIMAATVGAGTTSGFYSASGVFSAYKVNPQTKDDNTKYRAIFTRRAFKQGIQEQKMHEYEYLKMRRRAYWER